MNFIVRMESGCGLKYTLNTRFKVIYIRKLPGRKGYYKL